MLLDALILILIIVITKPASSSTYNDIYQENINVHDDNDLVNMHDKSETTTPPCGQYGFRCIDERRFQICPYIDVEGTTELPEMYHECKDGFVCDEDNPAYCSPADKFKGLEDLMKLNLYPEYHLSERNIRSSVNENMRNNKCACETTTPEPSTTTLSTTTEEFSTVPPPTTQPPMDCETYGFYPDDKNKSLFWYCDVPNSGEGFLLRHMMCGNDRYFDPMVHACVLRGTIRTVRTNLADCDKTNQGPCPINNNNRFSCQGKCPGKYADDDNCQLYHVCLANNYSPVKELLFTCPEKTAFDPKTQRCSRLATYRCLNKCGTKEQVINKIVPNCNNVINCKVPSRFRDLTDCGGYFLCYGDQLLEMRCPEYYKFDDNVNECLPEGIAKCDETDD